MEKYSLNLDETKHILCIYKSLHDEIELDLSQINMMYLNAYQYIDGKLSVDEKKMAELVAEEEEREKEIEIADLKKNLNDSDYIMSQMMEEIMSLNNPLTFIADIIKIFASYATKYKDTLADRKKWRERIEELKK